MNLKRLANVEFFVGRWSEAVVWGGGVRRWSEAVVWGGGVGRWCGAVE